MSIKKLVRDGEIIDLEALGGDIETAKPHERQPAMRAALVRLFNELAEARQAECFAKDGSASSLVDRRAANILQLTYDILHSVGRSPEQLEVLRRRIEVREGGYKMMKLHVTDE